MLDHLCRDANCDGIGRYVARNDRPGTYHGIVADGHAAMVLKMAAGVDEHILAHLDVLAEIGIKRREHTERGGDGYDRRSSAGK